MIEFLIFDLFYTGQLDWKLVHILKFDAYDVVMVIDFFSSLPGCLQSEIFRTGRLIDGNLLVETFRVFFSDRVVYLSDY